MSHQDSVTVIINIIKNDNKHHRVTQIMVNISEYCVMTITVKNNNKNNNFLRRIPAEDVADIISETARQT